MPPLFKKLLAALLALALTLSSWPGLFGSSVWAGDGQTLSAENGLEVLNSAGFFKEDKDGHLRSHIVDSKTGKLTPLGQSFAQMFRDAAERDAAAAARYRERNNGEDIPLDKLSTAELLQKEKDSLIALAHGGEYGPAKERAIEQALQQMRRDFGSFLVPNAGLAANKQMDLLSARAQIGAIMDGSNRARPDLDPKSMKVSKGPDGMLYVYSRDGEFLYKQDPNEKDPNKSRLFDKDIYNAQKAAQAALRNAHDERMGACISEVRLTGRYDWTLAQFQKCTLKLQFEDLQDERNTHAIMAMAEILGEHQLDMGGIDAREKRKELMAELSKRMVRPGTFIPSWMPVDPFFSEKNVGKMVDPRLTKRDEYLKEVEKLAGQYAEKVGALDGKDLVTRDEIKGLQNLEREMRRNMTLVRLESLNFKIDNLLDALSYRVKRDDKGAPIGFEPGPRNPRSRQLRDAIDASKDPEHLREEMGTIVKRLLRVMQSTQKVADKLNDSAPDSDLRTVNVALNAVSAELNSVNGDYTHMEKLLGLDKHLREQGRDWNDLKGWGWLSAFFDGPSYTPPIVEFFGRGINLLSKQWEGDWAGDYLKGRETIHDYRPKVEGVTELIAQGKHDDAALDFALIDPQAHVTDLVRSSDRGADRLTLSDRVNAVLNKAQAALAAVTDVHMYAGILIDTIKFSAVMAAVAPIAGGIFKFGAQALTLEEGVAAQAGFARTFFQETFQSLANRAAGLAPKERAFQNVLANWAWQYPYRFALTAAHLAYTSGIFSFIGAAMGMIELAMSGKTSPLWKEDDDSWLHWRSYGRAAGLGAANQVRWLTEGWHPLILFVNVPYTAYRGQGWLSDLTKMVAERGPVTGAMNLISKIGWGATRLPQMAGRALSWLTGRATLRGGVEGLTFERAMAVRNPFGRFLVQNAMMADHLLKFRLFTETLDYVGTHFGYWYHFRSASADESKDPLADVRREAENIKQAHTTGAWLKEGYWWMLLPQQPHNNAGAQEYMLGEAVLRVLLRKGTLQEKVDFANLMTGESNGAVRYKIPEWMKPHLKQSWREWIQMGPRDPNLVREGVLPTDAQQMTVLREIIDKELQGKYGKTPEQNPLMLVRLLTGEDGASVGENGLVLRGNVRKVLQERWLEVLENRPEVVEEIYSHLDKDHPDFGHIDLTSRDYVAASVSVLLDRGSGKGLGRIWGNGFSKDVQAKTAEYLKDVKGHWKLIIEQGIEVAVKAYKVGKLSKEDWEKIQELKDKLDKFEADQKDLSKPDPGHYTQVLEEIKDWINEAKAKGTLKAEAVSTLESIYDYFQRHEKAYHAHNHARMVEIKVASALEIVHSLEKNASTPEQKEALRRAREEVDALLKKELKERGLDGDKRVSTGRFDDWYENNLPDTHPSYETFIVKVNKIFEPVKKLLTEPQKDGVKRAVEGIQRAPWIMYNSQGQALKGWRPGQFLSSMRYAMEVMTSYGPDLVPKIFNQEPTGGGKTNILVRFVSPIQMAIAKSGGREYHLVTPTKILVEQMNREIGAMFLTGEISVKTWGDLVGDLAQRKLSRGTFADKVSVAIDEGDVPTLASQTTVGEQAGRTPAESLGVGRARALARKAGLDAELTSIFHRLEVHRAMVEADAVAGPRGRNNPTLRSLQNRILDAARNIVRAQGNRLADGKVMKEALETVTERSGAKHAEVREPLEKLQEEIERLKKLPGGEGRELTPQEALELNARVNEVEAVFWEAHARSLAADHEAMVDAAGIKDAYQAQRLKDLGREAIEKIQKIANEGLEDRAPATRWEAVKSFFGFNLKDADFSARVAAENRILSKARVDATEVLRELESLANWAEKLGDKRAARWLRAELQDLYKDTWSGKNVAETVKELRAKADQAQKLADQQVQKAGETNSSHLAAKLETLAKRAQELGQGETAQAVRALKEGVGLEQAASTLRESAQTLRAAQPKLSSELGRLADQMGPEGKRLQRLADNPEVDAGSTKLKFAQKTLEDIREKTAKDHPDWAQEASKILESVSTRQLAEALETMAKGVEAEPGRRADVTDLGRLAERLNKMAKEPLLDVRAQKLESTRKVLEDARDRMAKGHPDWAEQASKLLAKMSVRNRLVENAQEIQTGFYKRKPGWQYRKHILEAERAELMEKAVSKRSPVYEVNGEMAVMAGLSVQDRLGYLASQGHEEAQTIYANTVRSAGGRVQAEDAFMESVKDAFAKAKTRYVRRAEFLEAKMDEITRREGGLEGKAEELVKPLAAEFKATKAAAEKFDQLLSRLESTRGEVELARTAIKEVLKRDADLSGTEAEPLREAFRSYVDKIEEAFRVESEMDTANPYRMKELETRHTALEKELADLGKEVDARSQELALKTVTGQGRAAAGGDLVAKILTDSAFLGGGKEPVRYRMLKQASKMFQEKFDPLNEEILQAKGRVEKLKPGEKGFEEETAKLDELQRRNRPFSEYLDSINRELGEYEAKLLPKLIELRQNADLKAAQANEPLYREAKAELQRLGKEAEAAKDADLLQSLRGASSALGMQSALEWMGLSAEVKMTPANAAYNFNKRINKLSAEFADKLTKAYKQDIFLDPALVKSKYFKINGFWRMLGFDAPSEFVRTQLLSAYEYFYNKTSEFRFEGKRGWVETVFEGENMKDLQVHDKWVEEWMRDVDILDRLESKVLLGARDILLEKSLSVYATSGTASRTAKTELKGGAPWTFTGRGSGALMNPKLIISGTRAQLESVFWESALNSAEKTLTLLSMRDRAANKNLNKLISLAQELRVLSSKQIGQAFSDATSLKAANPEAAEIIKAKENRAGLESGMVLLQAIAKEFGRGLDLPLRKYNVFRTFFDSPDGMSLSQIIQIWGRTSEGRIPRGSLREAVFMLDIETSQHKVLFQRMLLEDPVFRKLEALFMENAPSALKAKMRQGGRFVPDWGDIDAFVKQSLTGKPLAELYQEAVMRWIQKGMFEKEIRQHQASGFLAPGGGKNLTRTLPWAPSNVGANIPE